MVSIHFRDFKCHYVYYAVANDVIYWNAKCKKDMIYSIVCCLFQNY